LPDDPACRLLAGAEPAAALWRLTFNLINWFDMAETIDELTIHYEEDGQVLRKQLDKEVLTKGSWTTIMFLYQDLDRKSGDYGPHKVSIRRYQKREGTYLQRSKFEISSPAQARAVRQQIGDWFADEE
tara:strand:+ start:154 stop:537 length:384 start_codon:yes stop_codon:yes gene_type:complete